MILHASRLSRKMWNCRNVTTPQTSTAYYSDSFTSSLWQQDNSRSMPLEVSSLILLYGLPQCSVLVPLLYLLYTADLPTSLEPTTVTFAEDTAVIATDNDPNIASHKLQTSLLTIQHWLEKWMTKVNGSKSTHVSFIARRVTCPFVQINDVRLPQAEYAKYLPGTNTSLQKGSN
jgi:hypothetical protein